MEFTNFFIGHFIESYRINYFVHQNSESEKWVPKPNQLLITETHFS